jgi:predicted RNase H-like nuclease (RuvC/YqgF family)
MSNGRMGIANLDASQLAKLQKFEQESGLFVVALDSQYELARLNKELIEQLHRLEEETGVVLLAYEKK